MRKTFTAPKLVEEATLARLTLQSPQNSQTIV
jgi:hypothetical protein